MGPTLMELRARMRRRLSSSSTKFFTNEVVNDQLNEGQDVVAGKAPWAVRATFQLRVVPNSGKYALPPRVIHPTGAVLLLSNSQEHRITYMTPDQMDGLKTGSLATGTPDWVSYGYLNQSCYAELWPAPGASYARRPLWVRANVRPRPMVNDSDRTEIAPRCVQALLAYAEWRLKMKDEEPSQADRARLEFDAALSSIEESRLIEDADQFPTVSLAKNLNPTMWGE